MLRATPTAGLMKECVSVGPSEVTPQGSGCLAIERKGLWLPTAREMQKNLPGADKFAALDATIPVGTVPDEPQTV